MSTSSTPAPSALVDAYAWCPLCGSRQLSHGKGSLRCEECGHREFGNPVTSVAIFIFNAEGRVLLIRRGREPALGKWAPPGGFLDAGEYLEGAVVRETGEETGLVPGNIRYLASFPNAYVYQGLARPVCDVFFTAEVRSVDVTMQHGEVDDFQWINPREIDPGELAFDSMRRALAVLLRSLDASPTR
jgi:NADH pyrophosphatase NudC (nudix superfamily)